MNHYIFSVVKSSCVHPKESRYREWNDLNLSEAAALYGATDTLDATLNLRDEDGHCIPLVQRVDGLDMLCSDYRQYDRWRDDPVVHIYVVPWLVETLNLRLEFWLLDIEGIVYDRFFYLTDGNRIEDCVIVARRDLDAPLYQNMDVEKLTERVVASVSRQLGHDLHGFCVVQHLGGDYAYLVYGDQITPCDVLIPIEKLMKEGIL